MNNQKKYCRAIRLYFEGVYMKDCIELEPVDPTSIESLMITSVVLEEQPETDKLIITTCRPGFLIGIGGQRIDGLKNFLQKTVAKEKILHIVLVEDTMWN